MLAEVSDYEFRTGFIPDKVYRHTLLRVASTESDMLVKKGLLSVVFKSVVFPMDAHHRVADHRPVEIS